ncbi:hypothetical protein BP6252_09995 [Coleophoma cylindrospora]|uniref:Peptidase A1 domain-containing protein n=1 Tax=Coleophoma cylindrospora TaxID=1849047 RepID=A0A3D8QXE3_9HELO|nr:hypothetical protein BP6252_09995 [Coleophoma cylindrospora]
MSDLPRSTSSKSEPSPAPISFSSNGILRGNDGNWSIFDVSVGTPPQHFEVLASINKASVSLPFSASCSINNSTPCTNFQTSNSSTWTASNSTVGFDILYNGAQSLGNHSIVSLSESVYNPNTGFLGIGTVASKGYVGRWQYTGSDTENSSFIQSLKTQKLIPSVAFGYTAGAWYRNSSASLVLGGYDAAKLDRSDASFDFFADRDTAISVNLKNLSIDGISSAENLLSEGVVATFDSSASFLSLPSKTCDVLGSLLGLQLDQRSGIYTYNSSMYKELQASKPNMTFSFSNMGKKHVQTNITLSYQSLAFLGNPPVFTVPTWFFPMKVAKNESQAILGRAFFQEAYAIIDYDRNNFTIGQATFSNESNIITIKAVDRRVPIVLIVIFVLGLAFIVCSFIVAWIRDKKTKKYSKALYDKWINAHATDLGMKQGYEDEHVYHFLGLDLVHGEE